MLNVPGSCLSQEEISVLKGMRLTDRKVSDELSIEMTELMGDDVRFHLFLSRLKQEIGTTSDKVAASIFMKRYAFLAVIYLYAMTVWNKHINIGFSNISLESQKQDGLWLPSFYFKNLTCTKVDSIFRNDWRHTVVKELFANHLFLLINRLVQETNISKYILLENIAVYIFWLYESVLEKHEDAMVKKRAADDFNYIIKDAEGDLFGTNTKNPLTRYFSKPIFIEKYCQEIRVRKTCCFSCRLNKNPKTCRTCPTNFH
jgi:ferric iron reductase protein FhuF